MTRLLWLGNYERDNDRSGIHWWQRRQRTMTAWSGAFLCMCVRAVLLALYSVNLLSGWLAGSLALSLPLPPSPSLSFSPPHRDS